MNIIQGDSTVRCSHTTLLNESIDNKSDNKKRDFYPSIEHDEEM